MACPLNPFDCVKGVAKSAASDAFSAIAATFAKAADNTINWLWAQMSTATAIHLGGTAFNQLFDLALAIAVVLAVGIFVVQMAISALRRDPGGISRAAVGLVVMGIGGGVAVAVTDVLLQAVDAVSAGVIQVTTGDTMQQMGQSILGAGSIAASTGNPAGLILISLFAIGSVVVVWLALTVRKLLVIVAAVLAPFAFAGSVADFSRSWVRRWVEVVVALIFAKLILIFIFVIGLFVLLRGVGSTGTSGAQGITQTVSGILILALAGFAPWVAIRMAHFAGHHLEGMHAMAGGATAGATAVRSMARPVGAALMPGASLAGVAAGVGSSAKPWGPQTAGGSSGGTNPVAEPAASAGETGPSANGATAAAAGGGGAASKRSAAPTTANESSPPPASNGHGPGPSTNGNGSTPPGREGWDTATAPPASTTQREPDFWQSREAARNSSPAADTPIPPVPPVPPTNLPKGDPLQ